MAGSFAAKAWNCKGLKFSFSAVGPNFQPQSTSHFFNPACVNLCHVHFNTLYVFFSNFVTWGQTKQGHALWAPLRSVPSKQTFLSMNMHMCSCIMVNHTKHCQGPHFPGVLVEQSTLPWVARVIQTSHLVLQAEKTTHFAVNNHTNVCFWWEFSSTML